MNRNAVIFASYMPYEKRISTYIDILKRFGDCDIFVGINQGTNVDITNKWKESLKVISNITVIDVPKELEIDSDASAYQQSLKLYKQSNKKHDYIFFLHTKCVTHEESKFIFDKSMYLDNFINEKNNIIRFLENNKNYGGYFSIGKRNFDYSVAKKRMEKYFKFKHDCDTLLNYHTLYVIRGEIVFDFVNTCEKSFFTDNLQYRWFFEDTFPLIVDGSGYKRFTKYLLNG